MEFPIFDKNDKRDLDDSERFEPLVIKRLRFSKPQLALAETYAQHTEREWLLAEENKILEDLERKRLLKLI